jgi:hypothetical protein
MKLLRIFASERITHSFHLLSSCDVSTAGCSWADVERAQVHVTRTVRAGASTDAGGRLRKARALPLPYRCACDVRREACVAFRVLEGKGGRARARMRVDGAGVRVRGRQGHGARQESGSSGVAGGRHLNKESGGTGLWVYGEEDAPPCAAVDQLHLVPRDALWSGCFVFSCT